MRQERSYVETRDRTNETRYVQPCAGNNGKDCEGTKQKTKDWSDQQHQLEAAMTGTSASVNMIESLERSTRAVSMATLRSTNRCVIFKNNSSMPTQLDANHQWVRSKSLTKADTLTHIVLGANF